MIAWFSLRLLCGMSLTWCAMRRREVTAGFFRIQMLVVLGLSVLTALAFGEGTFLTGESLVTPSVGRILCSAIAVAAFAGSVAWTLQRRVAGNLCVFLIAAAAGGLLVAGEISQPWTGATVEVLAPLSAVATALVIGLAVTGMLLGHWYLTAPTMSIAPLSRLNVFLGLAAVARGVLSAIALSLAWDQVTGSTQGLWLGLRWLAGIAGPIVVAIMVWRILKYRNTQAATGVLFVGVILTFLGEMSGALVSAEVHVPL